MQTDESRQGVVTVAKTTLAAARESDEPQGQMDPR